MHFDVILDPSKNIFKRSWLDKDIFSKMHWEPQSSGTTISDEIASVLEKDWAHYLNRPFPSKALSLPEETDPAKTYFEGTTRQIRVNVYERSAEARTICITYYGLNCGVCDFNFEDTYGEIGKGYIHVHHLKPLAEIGKSYELNPIKDLRPVCPNCHAMLHQKKPAFSIEELKKYLSK